MTTLVKNISIYFLDLSSQSPSIESINSYFHNFPDFCSRTHRHIHFLPIPRPSDKHIIFRKSRYQDIFFSTDHEEIPLSHGLTENIIENIPSSSLLCWRYIICIFIGCDGSRTWRIARYKCEIKLTLSHRCCSCLEFFLSLSWKSDNNISRNRKKWVMAS